MVKDVTRTLLTTINIIPQNLLILISLTNGKAKKILLENEDQIVQIYL